MSVCSKTYRQSVFRQYHNSKHFSGSFTYNMEAKTSWHRFTYYVSLMRPMYIVFHPRRQTLYERTSVELSRVHSSSRNSVIAHTTLL